MKAIILGIIFAVQIAQAGGDHVGNGGDLCEMKFQRIRDDLKAWILSGGAGSLKLPENLRPEEYSGSMLEQMAKAQISCTDEMINIGDTQKTCRNWVDEYNQSRVECYRQNFLLSPDSELYSLVHHEYAGLSKLESNKGEISNYQVSRQILVDFDLPMKKSNWEFGGGFGFAFNQEDSGTRNAAITLTSQIQYFLSDSFSAGGAFVYGDSGAVVEHTQLTSSKRIGVGPSATYYFYSKNGRSFYFSQKIVNSKETISGLSSYSNMGQSEIGMRFFLSQSVAFGVGYTSSYAISGTKQQYGYMMNGGFTIYQ